MMQGTRCPALFKHTNANIYTMTRFIDPFSDFGFKKLFGEGSSKEALISLLNALLECENVHVVDLEYLAVSQLGTSPEERASFFDLYCKDSHGRFFVIEIQKQIHANFKERLLYYATHPIRRQARKGQWKFDFTPIYVIAIMNFVDTDTAADVPVSRVKFVNLDKDCIYYDNLTFILVEVPLFKKETTHIDSLLEWWLFLFQEQATLQEIPETLKDPVIMKYLEEAEYAKLSLEEQEIYEYSAKVQRDNDLIEYTRQREFEKRLAQGIAEGEARGERNKALQAAEVMLASGVSMEIVMKATNLDFDTLADLKARLQA